MKNATRRTARAASRASIALGGLGTADAPLVMTRDNVGLFFAATAGCVYQNPKTEKYRKAQMKRMAGL